MWGWSVKRMLQTESERASKRERQGRREGKREKEREGDRKKRQRARERLTWTDREDVGLVSEDVLFLSLS